jgi:cation diffusion facilitator CzcD-associated flavoprotein CzcO
MSEQGDRGRTVIVGAGIGGLATAIELRRRGFRDVTILERAADYGGTWLYNSYPGAACDVPSHLYSFSFAKRSDWSRLCSPQDEILRYLHEVARDRDVERLIVTGAEVSSCSWDDETRLWTLTGADGRSWHAGALVLATGQLHQPAIPALEGAERFAGHSFHSARWDHGYELRGKRVGVVGTGASAVQFIPEIAPQVQRLVVFQRTGNWFLPRRNRPYPAALKWLFEHAPGVEDMRRRFVYNYAESLTLMIRNPRTLGRLGRARSSSFMRSQLKDPELRARVWPGYPFGCKRILFSSDFLPALQRPNVELVTDAIAALTATGVRTAGGAEHELDCLIYATGFRTTEFMFPMEITGAGGLRLRDAWAAGPHAHLGITVPGFPSMFILYGPNTNTSGGSIIVYEEAQAGYVGQALEAVRARGAAALAVRPEVEAASDRELQSQFAGTAWTACDSWYRDESGRIVTNWPRYMRDYERRTRTLDPSEFTFLAPTGG